MYLILPRAREQRFKSVSDLLRERGWGFARVRVVGFVEGQESFGRCRAIYHGYSGGDVGREGPGKIPSVSFALLGQEVCYKT